MTTCRLLLCRSLLLAVSALGFVRPALAVMPTDEVIARLKASGQFEKHVQENESARRRGVDQPDFSRLAASGHAAVTGELRALVLLVDFSDNPASAGTFTDTAFFNHLLFSTNVPGTSMNDHYREMSLNQVSISGLTVNWLRMPQTYAFYVNGQRGFGSYPQNAQRLAMDAVDAAEAAGVNFSLYDNDGDGNMDGLFIVHAGPGYEETGDVNQIHSHSWALATARHYDGVTISQYTMEPEEQASLQPVRVGVFSHEYGHFLGLPDLYDTDYSSAGVGRWCLMASGSWANGGTTPAHMSAWCKYQLGWVHPANVSVNRSNEQILQAETSDDVYRMWTAGSTGNQYFLVENRQRTGFDTYLPGEGILVWHIDENKFSNDQEWYPGLPASQHLLVALEQSDGDWDLEHGTNSGDNADPWPGSEGHTEFSNFTVPDSKAYGGAATQIAVWGLSGSDSVMTANLDIFYSQPYFGLENSTYTDDGNANGRPDPGENVSWVVYERNLGAPAADVTFLVTSDDPQLEFLDSTSAVGTVATGILCSNAGDPFTFHVPSSYVARVVEFHLTVTSSTNSYLRTDTILAHVGPDQVLLVDDDARLSPLRSYDSSFIMPVLDSLRVPYAHWEVKGQGTPTTLSNYPAVIWYTGDRRTDPVSGPDTTLTPSERAAIAAYLAQGGHLWLTGQQVAHMLDIADSSFMHNYLHAAYGGAFNDFMARGVEGDVVGDQTLYVLGGGGGAGNQLDKDLLVPVNGAVPAFSEDANPSNITGIRYEGACKVLFLGWGVEGIGDDVAYLFGAQTRSVLIGRAIDWLVYNAVFSGVSLQPLVVNPGSDPTHLVDTAIDLHWNFHSPTAQPQDSFQVQVGSDGDWSVAERWTYGPVASADTTVHYAGTQVLPGQTGFWRVRVFSEGAWSSWANSSWHMNAAPAAPALYAPVGNAVALQNGPVLTTANAYDPEGDACTYAFEVYLDSALTTLLAATTGVPQGTPRTSWTVNVTLAEQGRAFWRARASDAWFDGPWSPVTPFHVDGVNERPSAPALDSPADSALVFTSALALGWSGATDPDLVDTLRYRVHVDTQSSFATALVYNTLTADTLNVPGVLEPSQRYWWRVVVVDKGGLADTSAVHTFRNLLSGDTNGDGLTTAADVVIMVNFVFKSGPPPDPVAVADVNANCAVTSSDIIYLVNYVFKSGPAPLVGCTGP
jgi:immune inhibitor A